MIREGRSQPNLLNRKNTLEKEEIFDKGRERSGMRTYAGEERAGRGDGWDPFVVGAAGGGEVVASGWIREEMRSDCIAADDD